MKIDGNTIVTIVPGLTGTGLTNSNLKLLYSCTVWSSASSLTVAVLIYAGVVGVKVAVLLSTTPVPKAFCVWIVIETGEKERGFLTLSIKKEKEELAVLPVGNASMMVKVSEL